MKQTVETGSVRKRDSRESREGVKTLAIDSRGRGVSKREQKKSRKGVWKRGCTLNPET